jgi:hypothetical protein
MKISINKYDFRDAFKKAGRENNFSYDGLGLIFDYLEEQERDLGEDYELDIIALCCELSEEMPDEIRANYKLDADCDVLDYLLDCTTIIGTTDDGAIIYVQF